MGTENYCRKMVAGLNGSQDKSEIDEAMSPVSWVEGYTDAAQYITDCRDEDDLWKLARVIAEDAMTSGYGEVEVGSVYAELILMCFRRGVDIFSPSC